MNDGFTSIRLPRKYHSDLHQMSFISLAEIYNQISLQRYRHTIKAVQILVDEDIVLNLQQKHHISNEDDYVLCMWST